MQFDEKENQWTNIYNQKEKGQKNFCDILEIENFKSNCQNIDLTK